MAFELSSSFQESTVLLVRDVAGAYRPAAADEVLQAAQTLLWKQVRGRQVMDSPAVVREFLRLRLRGLEHEVFALLMLDAQLAAIEYVELFRGTVSQTSVYPREVVKECLARNAAAVVLVHNHPSGVRNALTRGRAPHADAEAGARADRHAGTRSPDRRGHRCAVVRRARLALAAWGRWPPFLLPAQATCRAGAVGRHLCPWLDSGCGRRCRWLTLSVVRPSWASRRDEAGVGGCRQRRYTRAWLGGASMLIAR